MKIQKLSALDRILKNMQNLNVVISESFHIVVLQKMAGYWPSSVFVCLMNLEEIEVHKHAKKEQA